MVEVEGFKIHCTATVSADLVSAYFAIDLKEIKRILPEDVVALL